MAGVDYPVAGVAHPVGGRLQSEWTKKQESILNSSNKFKKTRLINESKQKIL